MNALIQFIAVCFFSFLSLILLNVYVYLFAAWCVVMNIFVTVAVVLHAVISKSLSHYCL